MLEAVDIDFIIEKCPLGLLVLNDKSDIIYRNRQASLFLRRFELPHEVSDLSGRIFEAVRNGRLNELFPGEIHLTKKFDGYRNAWMFRFYVYEKTTPMVYVMILEEKLSNKIDMNRIRRQFRLTRRETDILRRIIDGMKNIEIAEDLQISEQTVKDHLSNIYGKTASANRLALIRTLMEISPAAEELL